MNFYLNKTLTPVSSWDEIKSILCAHHATGVRYRLEDEETGLCLQAVCLLHSQTQSLYSLSYLKTGTSNEYFTSPVDADPDLDWVIKYFESFYRKDDQWLGFSAWSETADTRSLVYLFVIVAVIGALILVGKYFVA
ncbi:MAG: hypothetical protein SGI98_01620 [Verrucomicrobiota bacterium]|nr:hypothetical protein [Verrucomicrobiota bacterium]